MSDSPRRMLPLLRAHQGGRTAMTCKYKCGDACSHPDGNTSNNEYFGDIVAASISRRSMLKAGGAGAAVAGLTLGGFGAGEAAVAAPGQKLFPEGFKPIQPQPATKDAIVVPEGWEWKPVIAWGDPIFPDSPKWDFDNQSAKAQKTQFGYNNDFLAILPRRGVNKATLVANHEYTNDELMFRGVKSYKDLTDEQLRIIMAAHGMTVVEVERKNVKSPWKPDVKGARNRRIDAHTPFHVTGAAAGSKFLQTKADPRGRTILGTLNNCAGGVTPWGTILSGEENVDQYFNAKNAPADRAAELKRYTTTSEGRGWDRIEDRFDVAKHPNEVHRFGWVVEIDPEDPNSIPRKHTALGRFKHEGATIAVDEDGSVVAYSGDDARFEYLYKFVSSRKIAKGDSAKAKAHNMKLLTEGDLYVAKFIGDGAEDGEYDGTGVWLPLVKDGKSKVPGMSVEEVLVFTRMAGDKVGATKMDRPEDVETNPVNNRTYMALTNNTQRTPSQIDEANPRANNKHGHVMEITPTEDRHANESFTWKIVLLAGIPSDPSTYFNGFDKSQVTPISCPDNVAFDSRGNLWISTDGQPGTLNYCDGLFMMPLEGPNKGKLQQFLSVPTGAETCGPVISWDERTIMVCVQHPGEVDGATPEKPASTFPYTGVNQPRPAVVQAFRK